MSQPMIWWVLAGVASVAALVAIAWAARAGGRNRDERRRARQAILGDLGRLPMREHQPREVVRPTEELTESGAFAAEGQPESRPSNWSSAELAWLLATPAEQVPGARTVETPDGKLTLTPPPFRLRKSVMSHRERAYARALASLIPSGFVMCPQVRLDALLAPTAPGGRSADDWRNWRRRVRLRAVDFVVCRLPDWTPVLALEVEGRQRSARAFQRDRIIDETLIEVGLPVLRCTGDPEGDWPMIEPYLREQPTEAHPADPGETRFG
jgi:hypothetical protein